MPIHLPPLSRRQFLRRSLVGLAGLWASQPLMAAGSRRDANTFALLADTHIAANSALVARETNMTDNLKAVTAELIGLAKRPSAVLIAGDCAFSRGEPGDYSQLVDLLQPIRTAGVPVHLALGNHDHRDHFLSIVKPRNSVRNGPPSRHVAIIESPRANWFIVDSLDKTLSTPGLLGEEQLAWLARLLDKHRRKPAIVVAHHNPDVAPRKGGLMDTEALFQVLRPRRYVKAYVFGHTHRWELTEDSSGIYLINLPPTAYVFDTTRPSGWIQAVVRKEGISLELRSLNARHADHARTTELSWRT